MDAIVIEQLTKSFARRSALSGHTTLKDELLRWVRRKPRPRSAEIDVLKGIDLRIPRGSTYGIIGKNGSGKSTLLKLMTGIYQPTTGSIAVRGRISALLELGAGFHPDFSGRENIVINGIILGMSRAEIRRRAPEVIAFSELGEFIDEPVRTYSSGMYMRLAFAVATHVDPDVLIIDEILSVGDDHFARKSLAKMSEFKRRGKTIVLVTHDVGSVQSWCDQAAWLDQGVIRAVGTPGEVVNAYRRSVASEEIAQLRVVGPVVEPLREPSATENDAQLEPVGIEGSTAEQAPAEPAPPPAPPAPIPKTGPIDNPSRRWGNFKVEISHTQLLGPGDQERSVFDTEESMAIALHFIAYEAIDDAVFGIAVYRDETKHVYGTNTAIERIPLPKPLPTTGVVRIDIARLGLIDGDYSLEVAAHSVGGVNYDYQRFFARFAIRSSVRDVGIVRPVHQWSLTAAGQRIELRAETNA